jgi:hypothetical protein
VRDFTLASHSPTELQQRQRQFVQQLIQEHADDSSASFATAFSYIRGCLKFHVRGAVKIPLCEDTLLKKWIEYAVNDNPEVLAQVLASLDRAEVARLAEWHAANNDALAAVTVYTALCDSSGLDVQAKIDVSYVCAHLHPFAR